MNRHSATPGRADSGKRDRILEAAIRVFAEKGFFYAKVSEIAREAGVADGTIYLYFRSKDDVLISLFEDRMAVINQRLRESLEAGGTPAEQLRRLVETHFALVESEPALAEVLTVELRQSSKFMKEYRHGRFGEFLKILAEPIEAGQRDGSFRDDVDPPVIARALFGAMDDLALAWVLRPREPKTAEAGQGEAGKGAAGKGEAGKGEPAQEGRARVKLEPNRVASQLADLFVGGLRADRASPRV